ncbi:hypothetical protein IMY05_016G0052700 [Salix suchowensis]|nr:hypothetical protein IMY05_016G0052700 [Salix suchowensis]
MYLHSYAFFFTSQMHLSQSQLCFSPDILHGNLSPYLNFCGKTNVGSKDCKVLVSSLVSKGIIENEMDNDVVV